MQAAARDGLTAAQVTSLLAADTLSVTAGCELYDADENFLQDISDDLVSGTVERGIFKRVHGTCSVRLSRELQWGSQRIKPYVTISDGVSEARFNVGVFLLSTPQRVAGETPATFEVGGFDKLEVLDQPLATSYRAASGAAYLTLVETLITDAGESKVLLAQDALATTLPSDRVWSITEDVTRLTVINSLLAAVGYHGLWVDQDGFYRSEPYESSATSATEWSYDADSDTTTVGVDRMSEADFFNVPNRWVFVRDNPAESFPTEGAGIYTVTNQSDGPTSVDGRGRTIPVRVPLDVASQDALVVRGDRIVEADKKLVERLTVRTSPNPLHLHFDVVRYDDDVLGTSGRFLVTDWRLDLGPADMELRLKAV